MRAGLTNDLIGVLATKVILDRLLLLRAFDCCFESIEEHLEEFLRIHLFEHVRWLSLPIFESVAKTLRIHVLSFRFEQSCK